MRDPENTYKLIIATASGLFNTRGYKATSISDITNKGGFTKGAIYQHFKDKSALEKACLSAMCNQLFKEVTQKVKEGDDAPSKLNHILDYFACYGDNPLFEGGCPLLNAAIEVDDSDAVLKEVVGKIVRGLQAGIAQVIQNGIDRKQMKNDFDVNEYASIMYSAIEGGIMMMKITDDDQHLSAVIKFLKRDIQQKTI